MRYYSATQYNGILPPCLVRYCHLKRRGIDIAFSGSVQESEPNRAILTSIRAGFVTEGVVVPIAVR